MSQHSTPFSWADPFLLEHQLSNDERAVRDAAHAYCQERLAPRVLEAFRHEKTDRAIFNEMGALGLLGPTIPEAYGGMGLTMEEEVMAGFEIARTSPAFRSLFATNNGIGAQGIVLDGTDAVMLSAESAAGNFPLETIEEMAKICVEAEKTEYADLEADFTGKTFMRIDKSIAMGALITAHHLGAKAIVALTDSGSTPLWMSRHDIRVPIYALTPRLATQRKMALYRNVRPLLMDTSADRDTALEQAEGHLLRRNIVQSGDVYAITCGEPMGAPGGTNMLKICRVA